MNRHNPKEVCGDCENTFAEHHTIPTPIGTIKICPGQLEDLDCFQPTGLGEVFEDDGGTQWQPNVTCKTCEVKA